jgi:hypothetical protein
VPRPLASLSLLGLGFAVLAAGCGGTKSYSLEKTNACLSKEHGVRLDSRVDFVASTALGGAVVVKLPNRNQATIAFTVSKDETERITNAYRHFHGKNIAIADALRPDHNAILLWTRHPSTGDIAKINGCLR